MTNRRHNIFGSLADWDKLNPDLEALYKNADDAAVKVAIIDDTCPCCGFRPAVEISERKKPRATGKFRDKPND